MAYCAVLRAYGNYLNQSGQPLYKWRHLCAFFQKERLTLRPYMPLCWDLATRWERLCPTAHRTPIPYALARAVISLALALGWARFAAVVGLSFFGTARVGEPLRAHRGAILLSRDLLLDDLPTCYVRVEAPLIRRAIEERAKCSTSLSGRQRLFASWNDSWPTAHWTRSFSQPLLEPSGDGGIIFCRSWACLLRQS